ncbi:MAG: 16S rRNA (adenine(1518)-N(6)/adenine(1519)-N(6))-dimethyltransferase RsmA [Dehalococcoidia bacterium]|nr:16S rRNA (adenine(1518)-N(6)/adenine(1519)-N(6))-dimethyltransferase RsmA [Dehalococcoidia bacterium]
MARRTTRSLPQPRRSRLGQNFLVDYDVAKRTVAAAQLKEEDEVLEIGPGKGALTRILVHRAHKLVAVELDPDLSNALSERFAEYENFTVLNRDALEFDPAEYFTDRYKVVANLPYYAATPIIRKFLASEPPPKSLVVMVQKEVAINIAASPGNMTLLSVMVQLYGAPKILFSVPPRSFRPMPKVTSAVLRIDLFDRPVVEVGSPESFIEFAAAGFRAPRKQIRNSLRLGLNADADPIDAALNAARIDGSRRPATLSLSEWASLYESWNGIPHE